jgi:hypothetical protein
MAYRADYWQEGVILSVKRKGMSEPEEDRELSPPRKGDVLMRAGDEFPMVNACLNFGISEYAYRQGYRRAAKILAEYVCNECEDQDLLVYPIVHNYRHHVELTLKHLIALGSYLCDRAITPQTRGLLRKSHNLKRLWETLKPILFAAGTAVGWKPENADVEGVESYIQQLSAADERSCSFRYATDTDGNPSLPGMTHLNIYVFANHMEQLAEYLETIAFGFSMEEDLKQEYEAYVAEIKAEFEAEMRSCEPSYDEGYCG